MSASITRTVFDHEEPGHVSIIPVQHLGWFLFATGLLSLFLYFLTMYPTITWWEDSSYSLAAVTLGVAAPPGSLLLTILGWLVTRLPLGLSKVVELHAFAGVIASSTVMVVAFTASRLLNINVVEHRFGEPKSRGNIAAVSGLALGALLLTASPLLWDYATRFTPYVVTALFGALILLAIVSWWRQAKSADAGVWLFIVMLLFGLDVSVHRTNSLMFPAFMIAILIRHPRTFLSLKAWLNIIIGFALGLAFHLLLIPIAAAKPFLNIGDPSSFSRFWEYVSLKQFGGGFLVNLFPRKGPFWGFQVKDYLDTFANNFFNIHGPLRVLGLLPGLLGLTGFIISWKRNPKLSFAMTLLFLMMSFGMVVYLNQPANFFRSLDRHYLSSFVIFSVWIAYGSAFVFNWLRAGETVGRRVLPLVAVALVGLAVANQVWGNYHRMDGSHRRFAYNYFHNFLTALAPNAVLLTSGDNDTFGPWYLQQVEGFRTDVTVCNWSLLNTHWYVRQVMNHDGSFPARLTDDEIDSLNFRAWSDSTFMIPIPQNAAMLGLPDGAKIPDTMALTVTPTYADKYQSTADQVVLKMIQDGGWRRPIYFSGQMEPWLKDYLRMEGLVSRLVPAPEFANSTEILRDNLFMNYDLSGYNDSCQVFMPATRSMAANYVSGFMTLAYRQKQVGDDTACVNTVAKLKSLFLLDRLDLHPQLRQAIERICPSDSTETSEPN